MSGLLVLGAVAVELSSRVPGEVTHRPVPSAAARSTSARTERDGADALGVRDRGAVDASDVIARATARAVSWDRDALLVSIEAKRVRDGTLDLTGGSTLSLVFGTPSGKGFGAGVQVAPRRFVVELTDATTTAEERRIDAAARAALEPGCPFEKAVRAVRASGVSANVPLTLTYSLGDGRNRPVWTALHEQTVERTLDGSTCAILVR